MTNWNIFLQSIHWNDNFSSTKVDVVLPRAPASKQRHANRIGLVNIFKKELLFMEINTANGVREGVGGVGQD